MSINLSLVLQEELNRDLGVLVRVYPPGPLVLCHAHDTELPTLVCLDHHDVPLLDLLLQFLKPPGLLSSQVGFLYPSLVCVLVPEVSINPLPGHPPVLYFLLNLCRLWFWQLYTNIVLAICSPFPTIIQGHVILVEHSLPLNHGHLNSFLYPLPFQPVLLSLNFLSSSWVIFRVVVIFHVYSQLKVALFTIH